MEILLKAEDYTHPDAEKDRRGAYKRGDPVVVKPDGWTWGTKETVPTFYKIRVTNFVPDDLLPGGSSPTLEKVEIVNSDGIVVGEQLRPYRRRRWELRVDDLNPNQLRTLDAGEVLDLSPQNLLKIVYDKEGEIAHPPSRSDVAQARRVFQTVQVLEGS